MKIFALGATVVIAACAVPGGSGSTSTAGSSGGTASGGSTGGSAESDLGCAIGSCSLGRACNPGLATDPCSPQGLACSPDYTGASPTGALCELPGEYFECQPSVGCAAGGLECVGADDAGDPGGCLEPCTTTADCWDPLTVCTAPQAGAETFCLVNGCNDFWQTCSAASPAGNDGTCIYLYDDPQLGPQGACLQGGAVPSGGACNYYRAADAGLCEPQTVCMINAAAQNSGVCMAACDGVADGGPACAGVCVLTEPPAPPPAVSALDFTQGGGCATSCSASDPNCAAPLSCYQLGPTSSVSACLP